MSIFSKANKQQTVESSAFSEFIRSASAGEKKRVYTKVLEKASKMQDEVVKRSRPASNAK